MSPPVVYKAECSDNESFKKYGRVYNCELRHVKQFKSVMNFRVLLIHPVSPDQVSFKLFSDD